MTASESASTAPGPERSDRVEERFGLQRNALAELPVLDISAFVEDRPLFEKIATSRQLKQTCIDIGFFYLIGHGVSQDELDALNDWSRKFFELPSNEKLRIPASKSAERLGYVGVGGADGTAEPTGADLKERFHMSREAMPGEPLEGSRGAGKSQWPSEAALPGFTGFMKDHIAKRVLLARRLARAFALSLELPESHFDSTFAYLNATQVLNYYPPLDGREHDSGRWSFSPHSDYCAFTLLSQDRAGGLEVRNSDGDWIAAAPMEGAFIVNIGDLFARWTNDLYASTLHRALNAGSGARLSAPMFVSPQGATVIECLPTCRSAQNPPRYPPVTAADYVRNLRARANETGKPGIGARTAERLAK